MEFYVAVLTVCAVLYVLVQVGVAIRQYLLVKHLSDLVNRIRSRTLPRLEDTVEALNDNIDDVSDVVRHRIEVTDEEIQKLADDLRETFADLRGLVGRVAGNAVSEVGSGLVGKLLSSVARSYFQGEDDRDRPDDA